MSSGAIAVFERQRQAQALALPLNKKMKQLTPKSVT
jgi:hypothetical protein